MRVHPVIRGAEKSLFPQAPPLSLKHSVLIVDLPSSLAIRAARELSERLFIGVARAVDIRARQDKFSLQMERLLEAFNRLRHPVLADPLQILWRRIGRSWVGRDAPAVPRLNAIQQPLPLGRRHQIDQGLVASGNEGIKVDQLSNAVPRSVGHASRHHTTVAVTDQHDLAEVFKLQDAEQILNMSFEIV